VRVTIEGERRVTKRQTAANAGVTPDQQMTSSAERVTKKRLDRYFPEDERTPTEASAIGYILKELNDHLIEVPFSACWAEERVEGGWVFAYRLSTQEGRLVVSEVRVFPDVWKEGKRDPGRWRGDLDGAREGQDVPKGGLTTTLLRQHLAAGKVLDLSSKRLSEIFNDRPVPEVVTPVNTRGDRPGPKPRPDLELAQVAEVYVVSPHRLRAVAKVFGISVSTARGRVYEARQRGLLTRNNVRVGVSGGELTPKARALLRPSSTKVKKG
jgi:hypothetical protein